MKLMLATLFIFGLSSRVRSKTYIDIVKLLDQQKCTERQYGALIVGNTLHTDCGAEISTPIFQAQYTCMTNRRIRIMPGTVILTEICLVSCIDSRRRDMHAERTIIANSQLILRRQGPSNKAFLVTYLPPCSGGPSYCANGGRRSPAVACWASDHWVASSNPLRGKFRH